MALLAIVIAPRLASTPTIFAYLQKMNALYFIPLLAVVLVGMLTRRVPALAANIALPLGCVVIAAGYFTPPLAERLSSLHEFHFVAIVFAGLVALMLGLAKAKPRAEPFVQHDVQAVDMTPWWGTKIVGPLLVAAVIAIYAAFADTSVFTR